MGAVILTIRRASGRGKTYGSKIDIFEMGKRLVYLSPSNPKPSTSPPATRVRVFVLGGQVEEWFSFLEISIFNSAAWARECVAVYFPTLSDSDTELQKRIFVSFSFQPRSNEIEKREMGKLVARKEIYKKGKYYN
jgi:hypothetical protein